LLDHFDKWIYYQCRFAAAPPVHTGESDTNPKGVLVLSKKGLALFVALIVFGSILLVNGIGVGAPLTNGPLLTFLPVVTFPVITKIPFFSYTPLDAVVNIPDAKLKAALHTVTGIPAATPIYRSDLAKLSGGLDLTNKGIVKVDGLQYCENITDLKLTSNKIADLPSSFNKMLNLQNLVLDDNKFTKIPDAVFTIPKLASLSMRNNDVTKIPDKINMLPLLTYLDMSGNAIDTISAKIQSLTKLQYLYLAKNGLKDAKLPKEIFLLPLLETLDLSGNTLGELPSQLATMPKLAILNVEGNILDALPAGLGNAPSLQQVFAARNRLKIIEPSLLNGKITNLSLDVNRITDLPQGLAGKTFDSFSIEWNFIDMSEGSDARKIADTVNAPSGKTYLRQLNYVKNPQFQATSTTITLTWQPLQDGSDGDGSWKVSKYQIYLDKNGSWVNLSGAQKTIADLDKLANQYVITGLKTNTAYKFQLGVEYSLTLNGQKVTHRFYVPIDTKTLSDTATAAITPEPTDTVAAGATATLEQSEPEPSATATAAKPAASNDTLVIVLIIVIAILLIGMIVMFAMLMSKRNQRQY
jgi:Leucine-rich repeat (LRR) protein